MNRRIQHAIDLLVILTQKDLKVRYKSSLLGYLWSVANPLAFAFVYFVAFKIFMRIPMENYVVFLITGLFPWQWFANSVNFAPMIFLQNASIIKKVNFPRNIIPFSIVLQDMFHFALSIPVIILFMLIYHQAPSLTWFWGIPLFLAVQFVLTYGVVLAVATLNLFFRDLERLTAVGMTLFFYFTPVIYAKSMIPEKFRPWINLNPLAPLVDGWRELLLYGRIDWGDLGLTAVFGLLAMLLATWIYRTLVWKFAEVL